MAENTEETLPEVLTTQELDQYLSSFQFHRRPSYVPEPLPQTNYSTAGLDLHAGESYTLDPFTGNIVNEGMEDMDVPMHMQNKLRQQSYNRPKSSFLDRSSAHFSSKNPNRGSQGSGENRLSQAFSDRRASRRSKRESKINDFYGNLNDPKMRMTIAWKDIRYSVGKDEKMKSILHGLDGQARPGEVVGIIGSSGAGKTTLMNILAGRVNSGNIEGIVSVNKRKRGPQWRRVIGYVEQEDLFYRNLTVKETLSYAALLRLPRYLTREQKLQRVEEIIVQLGLEECQNTIIGDENRRGISGGEKKRVSIGVELVTNPRMIFMDEPTTGLDSFTAFKLVQIVSNLAQEEAKTVIMTIHQPRESILFLFDKILLMSQGRMVFFGPPQSALDHFESLGYACPIFQNPANFFIDMISIDFKEKIKKQGILTPVDGSTAPHPDEPEVGDSNSNNKISDDQERKFVSDSQKRVTFLHDSWEKKKRAELERRNLFDGDFAHSKHPATEIIEQDEDPSSSVHDKSANNYWPREFSILLQRYMYDMSRDKVQILAIIFQQIFFILLLGFTFFQLPLDQVGIQSRVGALFLITIYNVILILQPIILQFPMEKPIIKKERWSSAYRNSTICCAKFISVIPLRFFVTILFGFSVYYIMGLNPSADRYFIFQVILLNIVFNSQALGFAISAAVPSVEMGQVVGPLIFLILLLYAGNFVGTSIPDVLAWIKYISTARYAYMSFSQNEFNDETFICSDGQPPEDDMCFGGGYATGEQVLDAYDLNELPIYTNCLILLGFTAAFYVFAMFALYITTKPKSKII